MKKFTNNVFKASLTITLLLLISSSSFAQIITTIAGTGVAGFSGDGGLATAAELKSPSATALDAAGNLYIVDFLNHRIRKVAATTGIISTVAGTGTAGFSGDGGLATAAQLNHPFSIALDAAENIYIVDAFNHRIRRISSATGNISTVAGLGTPGSSGDGGLATIAQLNIPAGIVFDAVGNYYIISQGNHKIRKVTVSTGIISTVAGVGTAGFSGDGGLATAAELDNPTAAVINAVGDIYIADFANHRVRKITAATGVISTIAGVGTAGFSGDGGLATAAELFHPANIALDAAENIYIADNSNHRIRKITIATGIISTVAGTGVAGFSGDGGLATAAELNSPYIMLDASGNFYIADNSNNRIRKVTFCTTATGTDTRTECSPFVWIDGNTYTTNNTTAKDTLVAGAANGCDSIVTLNLTITTVDTSVTQTGTDLTANELVATYQWLDCDNNYAVIPGATFRTYYVLANGTYAVEVTSFGCVDTSSCYNVIVSSVAENTVNNNITIYPNPVKNQLTITAENEKINSIKIIDVTGKILQVFTENTTTINVANLAKGLYILQIQTEKGIGTKRFIKE